jgi:hypothetical protein
MRWDNSSFFVEKFSNFHKCPMLSSSNMKNQFADVLNFTVVKTSEDFLPNETITFSFVHFSGLMMEDSCTIVTDLQPWNIYGPPGELYGDYEKMFLPFDELTWIAIAVTIAVAVLTILVIKMLSAKIQEVIFGHNNRSPLMNFIDIILNGGQQTNLNENGPRMFLLSFIFFSLIFR